MGQTTMSVRVLGVHKYYKRGSERVDVLNGLTLEVPEGESLGLMGPSGSGKTTLLNLVAGLDTPSEGEVWVGDQLISGMSEARLATWRTRHIGFIFQFYHLLPELSTLENVLMPKMIALPMRRWLRERRAVKQQATELLDRVGLGHRLHHKPRELSGGEMQRAAIARALVNRPRVLLADEPTGNLDADKGTEIIRLLRDLNRQERLTIIMVTHNMEIVANTDRVVRLAKGRVEDSADPNPDLQTCTQAL